MTSASEESKPAKKLVVFRLGTDGKDLACVSVSSYQDAIDVAFQEYYSELKNITRDRIQLLINIVLLDGTKQVARLTESGFADALDQFQAMKLVTVEIGPRTRRAPPAYDD
ncbi:hypothetical protein BT96DRAFT_914586, partial [Gymnopus androsaceus JB14]